MGCVSHWFDDEELRELCRNIYPAARTTRCCVLLFTKKCAVHRRRQQTVFSSGVVWGRECTVWEIEPQIYFTLCSTRRAVVRAWRYEWLCLSSFLCHTHEFTASSNSRPPASSAHLLYVCARNNLTRYWHKKLTVLAKFHVFLFCPFGLL